MRPSTLIGTGSRVLVILTFFAAWKGAPALAGVKILDQSPDVSAGAERTPPPLEAFDEAKLSEASDAAMTLTVRTLPGPDAHSVWVRATLTGAEDHVIRSVRYRLLQNGAVNYEVAGEPEAGYGLLGRVTAASHLEARVSWAATGEPSSGTSTLIAEIRWPADGGAGQTTANGAPDADPAGSEAPSTGVTFVVKGSPSYLEGGMETPYDEFSAHVTAGHPALPRIREVEYLTDPALRGEARRNFYVEGMVHRSAWPLTARIHWKDGRITETRINRP